MPETPFNLVLFFDTEELVGQTDDFKMKWAFSRVFAKNLHC